jgi:uncharacterized protein with FMN-binding domain
MKRGLIALGSTAGGLALLFSFHSHPAEVRTGSEPSASSPPETSQSSPPAISTPAANGNQGSASAPTAAPASTPSTTPSTTSPASATRTATGSDVQYRYGDIQVQVTESGSRVTNVSIVQNNSPDARSYQINSQAVPMLEQETISAGSSQIDGVSGATYTSEAYVQSLQSAIDQLNTR